jgi:streptomycin 6-kinase
MSLPPVELWGPVMQRAKSLGAAGAAWLADYPQTLERLGVQWGLTWGEQVAAGGTESVVFQVLTASGEPAALKLPVPLENDTGGPLKVLRVAGGRGYVRLIDYDPSSKALLLERLGRMLADLNPSPGERARCICTTLREAWQSPQGEVFTTGAEKAESLAAFIEKTWRDTDKPCERTVVDYALDACERRRCAFDPDRAVMAHGDAHQWNTLEAPALGPGRFKFVDPEGLFIESAYDLGIQMREDAAELLAGDPVELGRARCRLLSQLTGVDEVAIWDWGVAERVSTGLLSVQLGQQQWSGPMLEVAEIWARADRRSGSRALTRDP